MNQPHFSHFASSATDLGRPKTRRRFRGNLIVDSPIPTGQSPMSDTPYMPSLSQLREMLRNAPDVSQERINEIRRKLQSGAYLTRAAAEETAGRMLESGDFPEQA